MKGRVALITGTRKALGDAGYRIVLKAIAFADIVIVGDCPTGVDAAVRSIIKDGVPFAPLHPVEMERFEAEWALGKRGGPERNGRMVRRAVELERAGYEVHVHALPARSRSRGTRDCTLQALAAPLTVLSIPLGPEELAE